MLKRLHIQNYALIQELNLELNQGFTAITGETGSGKSILLGALGLVLGERADTSVLFDKKAKCIVEAEFEVDGMKLKSFFKDHDLDYSNNSLFRREINAAGRSRAFINDTPVSLSVLKRLAESLVDVHSQHQTLLLNDESFQLVLLDLFTDNEKALNAYQAVYAEFRAKQEELKKLNRYIKENQIDKDYLLYQLQELDEINLVPGAERELKEEQGLLENAEEIKRVMLQSIAQMQNENGLLDQLNALAHQIESISGHTKGLEELAERLESTRLELEDISSSIETVESQVEMDPERLEIVSEQIDAIQKLLAKHKATDLEGLITIHQEINERLLLADDAQGNLDRVNQEISALEEGLKKKSEALSKQRSKAKILFVKEVSSHFEELSLANAQIDIEITQSIDYHEFGKDDVNILFNANKGGHFEPLAKVASGGELSRLMLILKSQLAKSRALPTLIFDEIDTGVSGEIASQMAGKLRGMSKGRQVISITHLPQVAARSHYHLKISKSDNSERSITDVQLLDNDGRILELAKMLSGTKVSEASVANARDLLKN